MPVKHQIKLNQVRCTLTRAVQIQMSLDHTSMDYSIGVTESAEGVSGVLQLQEIGG